MSIHAFNTYSESVLRRRSRIASRLRYGAAAARPAVLAGREPKFPTGGMLNRLRPIPQPLTPEPKPVSDLPEVDVIAMMDTAPESRAMAAILTPGYDTGQWYHFVPRNFESFYLPRIGPHGPARKSRRLGSYFLVRINGLKVLIYKTELHMHEDARKLADGRYSTPIVDMLKLMIKQAKPRLFLTTGTSGGVYCSMHLGDVVVSRAARFYCMQDFKSAPFNHKTFKSDWKIPTKYIASAERIMHSFAPHLTGKTDPKGRSPSSRCACCEPRYPTQIHLDGNNGIPAFHPILTTDFFEFGTTANNLDKIGMAVEMDDACLGLACSEVNAPPHWACVRNLSDPTINGELTASLQESCAEYYYTKFGYWTTVMSALTTWAIIAGLGDHA